MSTVRAPVAAKSTLDITNHGDGQVTFWNIDDLQTFVMTQREVYQAAKSEQENREAMDAIWANFASAVAQINRWCSHVEPKVEVCFIAPRSDDIAVVVVATSDEHGNALHDQMAKFDLDLFESSKINFSWMMLLHSESSGVFAFIDRDAARLVYNAQSQAAHGGSCSASSSVSRNAR